MVRLEFVVRARIGIIPLLFLGCGADAQDTSRVEDQLSRIEAQLERMDEHLRSYEQTAIAAETVVIDLPTGGSTPALDRLVVTISLTELSIDGKIVAHDALLARLEELAASSPNASVIIEADTAVDHGRVVEVMDAIKNAGFSRIAIAVASAEPHED